MGESRVWSLVQSRRFLWICLIVAAGLRLAWVLGFRDLQQTSDFEWYLERARGLAAGDGYSTLGRPTAYWPIGYPLFLSVLFRAFGPSVLVGQLANVLLYTGIILFAYLLALELFRSRAVAGVTALVLAIYPNHIAYTAVLLSETLFTFLMLLGAWLTLRLATHPRLAPVAGVVWGLTVLTRTPGLVIEAVILSVVLRPGRKMERPAGRYGPAAVVVLFTLLSLVPYAVRNVAVFHRLVFVSTNSGVNLMRGNNPYADGKYLEDPRVAGLVEAHGDESEYDRAAGRYAARYIVSHPGRFLGLMPSKFFHLYAWDFDGVRWTEKGANAAAGFRAMRYLAQAVYLVVAAAFLLAAVSWIRSRKQVASRWRSHAAVGFWIVVAWTLLHLVTFGYARFHYPMIPWFVIYGATLIDRRPKVPAPAGR